MVVDHRPRAIAIMGVTQEEKEELMPHFVVRKYALIKSSQLYNFPKMSYLNIEKSVLELVVHSMNHYSSKNSASTREMCKGVSTGTYDCFCILVFVTEIW